MKWIKGTERLPKSKEDVYLRVFGELMEVGFYDPDIKLFVTESCTGSVPAKDVEWLDDESPSPVEGLVEALQWYADANNYLNDNGELATAWKNNENISQKAKIALKQYKP